MNLRVKSQNINKKLTIRDYLRVFHVNQVKYEYYLLLVKEIKSFVIALLIKLMLLEKFIKYCNFYTKIFDEQSLFRKTNVKNNFRPSMKYDILNIHFQRIST